MASRRRLQLHLPALLIAAVSHTGFALAYDCPREAPYGGSVSASGCGPSGQCAEGAAVTLLLHFPIPVAPFPTYWLQPCDRITWDFGDGSPKETYLGIPTAKHSWTAPGNYRISATVSNVFGADTFYGGVIVGTPAEISVARATANETDPSVTIWLTRTGDLTRTVSVRLSTRTSRYYIAPILGDHEVNVVFEPGDTRRGITLPLVDNHLFDGNQRASVVLHGPAGGVRIVNSWSEITIRDDEFMPTLNAEDLTIREGDSGTTNATFRMTLTGPLGGDLQMQGRVYVGDAEAGRDYTLLYDLLQVFPAGTTQASYTFAVIGDQVPEPDEHMTIQFEPGAYPARSGRSARVTILDNDANLTPRRVTARVGDSALFIWRMLPSPAPRVIPVHVGDPAIARTAGEVLVPAHAIEVPIKAAVLQEGSTAVSVDAHSALIIAYQPRVVEASDSSVSLPVGGKAEVSFSLVPHYSEPVTLTLSAGDIVSCPASVIIPPGGAAEVEIIGMGTGTTSIVSTPVGREMSGATVEVHVSPVRRRAVR